MTKNHRFTYRSKGGRKGNKGQRKAVRVGARNPGGTTQGSIRRPF